MPLTQIFLQTPMKDYKHRISVIRKDMIDVPIESITTKNIADLLHPFINKGKITTAKLMRVFLNDYFKEAISLGILKINPVTPTKIPKIKIQRSRLSFSDFKTILNLINDENHWLIKSMKIALVTGQRISDISKLRWGDIYDNKLWIIQQKTESKIAIPLNIEISNIKLSKLLESKNENSEYIISIEDKKLSTAKISKAFAKFRDKSELNWEGNPPSFHEIRSLSARLYTEAIGIDFAKKLLGHKSIEMTEKYQDERNHGWVEL